MPRGFLRRFSTFVLAFALFGASLGFAAGSLTNVTVTPDDSSAGQLSVYTIALRLTSPDTLYPDGKIKVIFPAEFDVSTVLVAMGDSVLDGGLQVQIPAGQNDTLYVVRDSTGSALSDTTVSFKIANVTNATTPGTYRDSVVVLTASNTVVATGGANFDVYPGPLHHFTISGFPATATAGVAFANSVKVTAYDAYGNQKTDYRGTVAWSSTDPQASMPANATFTGATYLFNGSDFTLKTAGAQTYTVTDLTDSIQTTSSPIDVNPAAIASFSLSGPTTVTAGTAFSLTVTNALDSYGNAANGTIAVSFADGNAHTAPDGTAPVLHDIQVSNGTGSATQTLYLVESNVTFQGTTGSVSQTHTVNSVSPGAVQSFTLTGYPTSTTAGSAFSATVTAYDAWQNVKTDYTGTVTFGSTDGSATLPADYTFVSGDNGSHTFTNGFVLKTAGQQTITVQETDGVPSETSSAIQVSAAGIADFTLSAPSPVTAGVAFDLSVSGAVDAYGNAASGTVTVSLTADGTSPNGTAPQLANITVTDGSGSAPQTLVKAGAATLKGTAGTVSKTVDVTVNPGSLNAFTMAGVPGAVTAGQAFSTDVTVTAYDAYGNQKTNYTGQVYFESTDGNATITHNALNPYQFVSADNGAHTFAGSEFTLKTAGAQTITVTDGTVSKESSAIDVSPAALNDFTLSAGSNQTAGVGFPLTVSGAVDAYGNAWSGTVSVAVASGGGASPNGTQPSLSDITVSEGSGSANQVLVNPVVTVLQGTADGVTRQTGNINVAPGALASFTMTGYPDTVVAGDSFGSNDVLVKAYDAYGNLKTNYSGSVYFTSSDAGATLPYTSASRYTFDPDVDAGQHTFAGTGFVLATQGLQTITVTDGSVSETSSNILVQSRTDDIRDFDVVLGTTQTAGVQFTVQVQNAVDSLGNPASGTVTVQIANGSGTSPNGSTPSLQSITVTSGSGSAGQVLVNAGSTVLRFASNYKTIDTTVTVEPGAFDELTLTGYPTTVTAGAGWSSDVTVTAYDRYGNQKTNYTGQVYFSSDTDPNAEFPYTQASPYTFQTTDNGSHTFSGASFKFNTPGTQTFAVTDVGSGSKKVSDPITVVALELVSVGSGASQVTRGQDSVEVNLVARNNGSLPISSVSGGLSFSDGSNDRSFDYTVTRTDTVTVIPAGGEVTLSFSVSVKTTAQLGTITVDGYVSGTSGGSSVSDNSATTTHQWQVLKPATLVVSGVAVAKDTVYQGDTGIAATLTIDNDYGSSQTSTAVIDSIDLYFVGQAGDQTADYVRFTDPANPTTIAGGQRATFNMTFNVVPAAQTGDVKVYGKVWGHDINSDAATSNTSTTYDQMVVKEKASLAIVSVTTSQAKVTRGQTKLWEVYVVVKNTSESAAHIDFDTDQTYIRFRKGGSDLTSEYSISTPTALAGGGNVVAANGGQDTLVYKINRTGTTTGEITIFARVAATEGIYTDSEISGRYGGVSVQTPPNLVINSVTPSQQTVTANQDKNWQVKVAVTNNGEADFDAVFDSTWISFSTGNDFTVQKPTAWMLSGTNRLAAGTTDTLVFTVTKTGLFTGVSTIDARVKGRDVNSDDWVSKQTDPTNAGQVTVQSPADIRIVAVEASDTTLTRDTSTNWTITVRVQNLGESSVTADLVAQAYTYIRFYTVNGDVEQLDYVVQWPTAFENSGTTLLAGNSTDELVYTVTRTGNTLGSIRIRAGVRAKENNSDRVIDTTAPDSVTDLILVQAPSNISYVSGSLSPQEVNRGSNARFNVRVHNGGGATVVLDANSTRFHFSDGVHSFDALLDSTQVVSVSPGDTTLTFRSQPVPANMALGTWAATVTLVGDENGNAYTKTLTLTDSVTVSEAADLAIEYTRASQPTVTAGQTRPWQIVMVVTNNGGSPVSLDSSRIRLFYLSTDVTSKLVFSTPTVFAGSGTKQLDGGKTDSLVYDVSEVKSDMPIGSIRIQGSVYVTDVNDPTRHLSQNTDGNSGYFIVQEPATLSVVRVRPWQPSVTLGQGEDWKVTVVIRNGGGSAVTVDSSVINTYLSFEFGTGWQVLPPSRLSNGTWVLEPETTDSLVFTVDQTDASRTGVCHVDARVQATENNSGRVLTANSTADTRGQVTVETPAQVKIDTFLVSTATVPNAPYVDTEQPFTLRVRVVNLGQDEADSVEIRLRSAEGYSTVAPSLDLGTVSGGSAVWGEVQGKTGVVPDVAETFTVSLAKAVARNTGKPAAVVASDDPGDTTYVLHIQKPAYLAIDSVWTDKDTVLAKQTSPYWHVYVAVRDTGSAPVIVADPAADDLEFRIHGETQTGYVVVPQSLSESERTLDPTGTHNKVILTYEIRQTGPTGGLAGIFATITGTDVNYPDRQPAPNATNNGQVFVASLASVQITRTEPVAYRKDAQGRAVVNTGQAFAVDVDVENKGGEDLLNVVVRLVTDGGSSVGGSQTIDTLAVGHAQTVRFAVTASDVENLAGETFTAQIVSATGRESGLQAQVLPADDDVAVAVIQQPARVRIQSVRNVAPNAPFVDTGQSFPIRVVVYNLGTEPAESVNLALRAHPDSLLAQPVYTLLLPTAVAGHDSVEGLLTVAASTVRDTVGMTVSVASAVGANTGQPATVEPPLSDSTFAIVQQPAGPAVLAVVADPDTVIAESREEWHIKVVVADTGEADVTFTPSAADVRFVIGGVDETQNYTVIPPTRLKGRPGLLLPAGQTDTLVYRVTETGPRGGAGQIPVQIRGYDRNLGSQLGQVVAIGVGHVFVETNAVVRIKRTEVRAPNISAQGWGIVDMGQTFQIKVTVEERQGREGVDSVKVRLVSKAGLSTVLDSVRTIPFLQAGGSASTIFSVRAANQEVLQGEVFQASIVAATAHESQIPASIEPPADPINARATVRIEKPANLTVNSSVYGGRSAVSVGSEFDLQIILANLGTAQVDTNGRAMVVAPAGYQIGDGGGNFSEGSRIFSIRAGVPLLVKMKAPDTASVNDSILVTLAVVPKDRNTQLPAKVSVDSSWTVVSTVVPFMKVEEAAITAPEGAKDGVLSTAQGFHVRAVVKSSPDLSERTVSIRLPEGRNYLVFGADTLRSVTRDSVVVQWYVQAPPTADQVQQYILVHAQGVDGTGTRRTDTDTIAVRTVRRASLELAVSIVSPPGAADGTLTQGQPFQLQAKVTNKGEAAAVDTMSLRLDLGNTGVELDPSETDTVKVVEMSGSVTTVSWRLRAPAEPHDPDVLTVSFERRPKDENTGGVAEVANLSQDLTVSTVPGGYVRVDSIYIAAPEGARDSVLSTEQEFVVTARFSAERVSPLLDATISFSSPEFYTESSVRKVTAGQGVNVSWRVRAPSKANVTPDSIWVTLVAHDANNDTLLIRQQSPPLPVWVKERADLSVDGSISAPPGGTDGVLSTGQTFVVSAKIVNRGQAGWVPTDSFRVRIILPASGGYTLAEGEPQEKSSVSGIISWTVRAPDQPTGAESIGLQLKDVPRDENSGERAKVSQERDEISVITQEKAKLVLHAAITEPKGARGGTVWTGQVFTVTTSIENLGEAGWTGPDSFRMKISVPEAFTLLDDSVQSSLSGVISWRVKAPQQSGQQYTIAVKMLDRPLDENANTKAVVVGDAAQVPVTVQAKMLIVGAYDVGTNNTVARGETAVPVLGLRLENRGEEGRDLILLQGLKLRFLDRSGKDLPPNRVAARIWAAPYGNSDVVVGETTSVPAENPVFLPFASDTLAGGDVDSIVIYVDVARGAKVRDFMVSLASASDVQAVDAESGTHVLIGDADGRPKSDLNINSDFAVLVAADLSSSFGCYPNPFGWGNRATTTIVYYLNKATTVDLAVYTIMGELVWEKHFKPTDPQGQAGMHDGDVVWDGRNGAGMPVLNGVYVVRIATGTGESAITKVAVAR